MAIDRPTFTLEEIAQAVEQVKMPDLIAGEFCELLALKWRAKADMPTFPIPTAMNVGPALAAAPCAPTSAATEEPEVPSAWRRAVALAYGQLWHVNNEPAAPIRLRSPEEAAYAARRLLRDLLTRTERGTAINEVGLCIGRYKDAALASPAGTAQPTTPPTPASEAVVQDAARYRFLKEQVKSHSPYMEGTMGYRWTLMLRGNGLDDAIDRLRNTQGERNGE